jgi:anaerobic magnesium-protoporphyrin IX monomethyl ester cyclase
MGIKLNVLLIQPEHNLPHHYAEAPSQSLLILGTLAEQKGHKVKIIHLDIDRYPTANYIIDFKPDVVGMTVNTFQVNSAKHVTNLIKSIDKNIKIIIGGPHAPSWNGDNVDEIVIGEGENKWLSFLGESPSINSMDDIPLLNYDLIDIDKFCGIFPMGATPSMCIMASRGCPFNCTFCNTPVFWGKKVRYRRPQYVVDEVERLHKIWGVNEIFFQDDTFNLNHKWAFEIFEEIIKRGLNKEMLFKIACRVNEKLLTQEFLDLAYKAGVWNIFFGVESGSQYMLDRMKKGITVDEIVRAFEITHQAKIRTQASFIVGLPGETWATLGETDKLIHKIKPSKFGWCYWCPFPNTKATKEAAEKGHIKDVDYSEYGYGVILARTDVLDYEDLASFKGFTYG